MPSSARTYSLNITAPPQYCLTAWPVGGSFPNVSKLNDNNGGLVANATIVPAGTNGDIDLLRTYASDVIIDINGYFCAARKPVSIGFRPLPPCRVADTRSYAGKSDAFGPPALSGGSGLDFPMLSRSCGIPSSASAQAYSLNMTAWPSNPLQYLTTWPVGQSFPIVSTLNSPTGHAVSNAAIVPAGTDGDIDVYVSDTPEAFFDINGYLAP